MGLLLIFHTPEIDHCPTAELKTKTKKVFGRSEALASQGAPESDDSSFLNDNCPQDPEASLTHTREVPGLISD